MCLGTWVLLQCKICAGCYYCSSANWHSECAQCKQVLEQANWEQKILKLVCGKSHLVPELWAVWEKDKAKLKRYCTHSINQCYTYPDKVYPADTLEQELEDLLEPHPRRQGELRGEVNSEWLLTLTPTLPSTLEKANSGYSSSGSYSTSWDFYPNSSLCPIPHSN